MRYIDNFKFYSYFNSESKLNTLVQKLHDFLAHSSEESEDANSPPALSKNKTIGKKTFYIVIFNVYVILKSNNFVVLFHWGNYARSWYYLSGDILINIR